MFQIISGTTKNSSSCFSLPISYFSKQVHLHQLGYPLSIKEIHFAALVLVFLLESYTSLY